MEDQWSQQQRMEKKRKRKTNLLKVPEAIKKHDFFQVIEMRQKEGVKRSGQNPIMQSQGGHMQESRLHPEEKVIKEYNSGNSGQVATQGLASFQKLLAILTLNSLVRNQNLCQSKICKKKLFNSILDCFLYYVIVFKKGLKECTMTVFHFSPHSP